MSFKPGTTNRTDRIATRFIGQVHVVLGHAAVEVARRQRLTRADVAKILGVNKSVITRILSGKSNLTIKTIGELAGALGYRPELVLRSIERTKGTNQTPLIVRIEKPRAPTQTSSPDPQNTHTIYATQDL
jgi:transcriptional regulator with XRE-family HTH domain